MIRRKVKYSSNKYVEEEKLDFKVYSGIKSETEIERKKIPDISIKDKENNWN